MELQTIRQKLQTLKASPPESVAAPWGQSRQTASPDLVQVTTAIETLRQRSGQATSLPVPHSNVRQFDDALTVVENLAQQQQQALRRLQAAGEGLMQQNQPGTSSDIDEIARFLTECQPIQIPTVQRDRGGYLNLRYRTVDFRQAEHDANSNAEQLRARSPLFKRPIQPYNHPTASDNKHYAQPATQNLVEQLKNFYQIAHGTVLKWLPQHFLSARRSRSSQFTLLDSAIWCIGAAIARIILNQLFQFYPGLWPPVAAILIVGILISLYSSVFSSQPNPNQGYRTLMIILGLLIGGRFS